jgi:plasmid stability protein
LKFKEVSCPMRVRATRKGSSGETGALRAIVGPKIASEETPVEML